MAEVGIFVGAGRTRRESRCCLPLVFAGLLSGCRTDAFDVDDVPNCRPPYRSLCCFDANLPLSRLEIVTLLQVAPSLTAKDLEEKTTAWSSWGVVSWLRRRFLRCLVRGRYRSLDK